MNKIAFMGAHSSAKTTTVNRLARFLADEGYMVEIVTETARDCPFEINEGSGFKAQLWMIDEQARKELLAEQLEGLDYILCDRALWDYLAYSECLHEEGKISGKEIGVLRDRVRTWVDTLGYDTIYFCEMKPLYDDGVRTLDPEWRDKVYMWFKRVVKHEGLKVTAIQ